ncbi:MAG TPA: beta-N-acetylhexosaminidase [Thermoanaerobaculia bacterium]|nr:beta-N-acetylhexosaminidase [Thermoanaerobaculia bacterium]
MSVLPSPVSLLFTAGEFSAHEVTIHRTDGAFVNAAANLQRRLPRSLATRPVEHGGNVSFESLPALPEEAYRLTVMREGVTIEASSPAGALYATETLLQLAELEAGHIRIRCAIVEDAPRFRWRGFLLDSVRHWMPLDVIRRTLDAMATVKLNVFHWHLTDDQAFRVESRAFPRLHQMSSGGRYYSHDDVRQVLTYAGERGIRVVPELDVPGHATSWVAAYPHLGCTDVPVTPERKFGIFHTFLNPARESTYDFLRMFFAEMAQLFPDDFVHIGGDEVSGRSWLDSEEIRGFMATIGATSASDLQRHFADRVRSILGDLGKQVIAWEEASDAGGITAEVYRSQEPVARVAATGRPVVVSYGYYLDLMRGALEHYRHDPLLGVDDRHAPEVIGGEACMWSEFVTEENVHFRTWPRLAAVAERLWSPRETCDESSLHSRLDDLEDRLRSIGIDCRADCERMLARIAPSGHGDALALVATALEPVKDYIRHESELYDVDVPLTRLVDAIRPESALRREMNRLVMERAYDDVADRFTMLAEAAAALHRNAAGSGVEECTDLFETVRHVAHAGAIAASALADAEVLSADRLAEAEDALRLAKIGCNEMIIAVSDAVERLYKSMSQWR